MLVMLTVVFTLWGTPSSHVINFVLLVSNTHSDDYILMKGNMIDFFFYGEDFSRTPW